MSGITFNRKAPLCEWCGRFSESQLLCRRCQKLDIFNIVNWRNVPRDSHPEEATEGISGTESTAAMRTLEDTGDFHEGDEAGVLLGRGPRKRTVGNRLRSVWPQFGGGDLPPGEEELT